MWHKLFHPDIPSLSALRKELKPLESGHPDRPAILFLLTLLCDIALDVPSVQLAKCRHLQPTLRGLTHDSGQMLQCCMGRSRYTVLAWSLAGQYKPLTLISSQSAGSQALKAIPYVVMAKYTASELGYNRAGARLIKALNDFSTQDDELKTWMFQCLHWIRLNVMEEAISGVITEWIRPVDPTELECLEALHTTLLYNRMPQDMLLPYTSISYWIQLAANVKDMTSHWKDLKHLEEAIAGHKAFCDREQSVLNHQLDQLNDRSEEAQIIAQQADMARHATHTHVVGAALFFSVMCGAFSKTNETTIQQEHALQISENIIDQLLAHQDGDPTRPAHRVFLEQYGTNRMDELEKILTQFITAADTLKLKGIPYIPPIRSTAAAVLHTAKDIVESNAAMLKGWGGLHDRVDVQMILFHECARRLEGMSASAGTEEALARGCVLTATAKLLRSLHRILQGFKRTVALKQRRSTSESSKLSDSTPNKEPTPLTNSSENVSEIAESIDTMAMDFDSLLSDDLFAGKLVTSAYIKSRNRH